MVGSSADVREVAWGVLAGVAAGSVAGLVVAGVGGRLAMLVLRLTSPDFVLGLTSDDGFTIGVVTAKTVQFVAGMAFAGAAAGAVYSALRGTIPGRMRLPLWTLVGAALGGASVVHSDGIDFALLEPAALAVALFVVIPATVCATTVVLAERWIALPPWEDRRRGRALVAAALLGSFGLAVGLVVGAVALSLRRIGLAAPLLQAGRVVVPPVLLAVVVVGSIDLVRDAIRIL